jgi:hypothetical protein
MRGRSRGFRCRRALPRIGVFTSRGAMLNELLNQYVAMVAKWRR